MPNIPFSKQMPFTKPKQLTENDDDFGMSSLFQPETDILRQTIIDQKAVIADLNDQLVNVLNGNFQPIQEGELIQIIIDTNNGKIPVSPRTHKRMKKGFAIKPFGGLQKKSGGWNSITYAIFESLITSNQIFIKK
ncbi:MAG: hypothetical protein ACXAC8_17625 [Candidatus Hodarchaeales archaeon]|jgi:hypothetical protein